MQDTCLKRKFILLKCIYRIERFMNNNDNVVIRLKALNEKGLEH